jgi:DNA-binding XRE family transcriptional regulator
VSRPIPAEHKLVEIGLDVMPHEGVVHADSEPQIITSPSEDKMAVLPMAEYERLVAAAESAGDLRQYDVAKRRLSSGTDEAIPSQYAKRLIAGDSPIRVWREYRGMSGKDLAGLAGVSAAFLSQIETGAREGKAGPMRRIAKALGVALSDLILE